MQTWTSIRVTAGNMSSPGNGSARPTVDFASSASTRATSTVENPKLAKEARPPPMPNLSNFLNPNNVFYHHNLAEIYRNMSKQEKDELWMMDILMRQAGNNSNVDLSSLGTSPAMSMLEEAAATAANAVNAAAAATAAALSNRHCQPSSTSTGARSDQITPPLVFRTGGDGGLLAGSAPTMGNGNMPSNASDSEAQMVAALMSSTSINSDMQHLDALYSTFNSPTEDTLSAVRSSPADSGEGNAVCDDVPLTTDNLHTWAAVMLQLGGMLPEGARGPTMDLVDLVLSSTKSQPEPAATGAVAAQNLLASWPQTIPPAAMGGRNSERGSAKCAGISQHPTAAPRVLGRPMAPDGIVHDMHPTVLTVPCSSLLSAPSYPHAQTYQVLPQQQLATSLNTVAYVMPADMPVDRSRMAFAHRVHQHVHVMRADMLSQQRQQQQQLQMLHLQQQPGLPVGPLSWG